MKAIIDVVKELANRVGWVIGEVKDESKGKHESSVYNLTSEIKPKLEISYSPGLWKEPDIQVSASADDSMINYDTDFIIPMPKLRLEGWLLGHKSDGRKDK